MSQQKWADESMALHRLQQHTIQELSAAITLRDEIIENQTQLVAHQQELITLLKQRIANMGGDPN